MLRKYARNSIPNAIQRHLNVGLKMSNCANGEKKGQKTVVGGDKMLVTKT